MTIAKLWTRWLERQASIREFNSLDATQREELARDTGVSSKVLESLSAQGPLESVELQRLMDALSLDVEKIKQTHAPVLRDMAMICSECCARSRCRRELDHRMASQNYHDYCPNTQTLSALRQERLQPGFAS